jgi:signal transduction histidine kinase/FixJ family two-component response regulator
MSTPLNVLIVEDRPADAELMVYELERVGFEPAWKRVETEPDFLAGLEANPDIVLADHTLPGFGAPQALELLKARGLTIPFIVVTGSISEEVAVERLKQGAADYILKDRMTRLGDAVTRALREKKLHHEKIKAEESLSRRYQELQALQEISQIILTSPDIKTTMERILEKAISLGSFELGIIRLFDPRTSTLNPVGWRGYRNPANIQRHRQRTIDGMTGAMTAEVIRSREPRFEEDVPHSSGLRTWKSEGVQSAIVIPMHSKEEVLGVLQLGTRSPRKFTADEVRLLGAIGDQAGIAIQKALLSDQTQRNLDRIRGLHEIGVAIASSLELNTILKVLLEKIELFLPIASVTTVRLLNRETGELESLACRGFDEQEWKSPGRKPVVERAKHVAETKAPLAIRNIEKESRNPRQELHRRHALVSYLGVPLIAKNEIVGVLGLYTKEEHEFSAGEIEFLNTLAGQAAIAIYNAQLYEQSRKQAEELETANKVKDEFLSVMSHELRTPLSVVLGYTGMIKEKMLGDINPRQEEALQKVLNRATDQLYMINAIMQTTQLEARVIALERHLVNLSELLTQLKADYDLTHKKSEVELIWDYPAEPVPLVTDSGKLRQILQNLVDNALKFTDRGSVTVSLQLTRKEKQNWVELGVADTGVGIEPHLIPRIFEKFYQCDSSETRLYSGVGLGLYIAQKFTELLRGTIHVQSAPRKGSAFTVRLPFES